MRKMIVRAAIITTASLFTVVGVFLVAVWRNGDAYELYTPRKAHVVQDGRAIAGARVFTGTKGHVLVTLPSRSSALYIYLPESQEVGDCNSHTFFNFFVFGLQKHTQDGHYPCAGRGKQEVLQNLTHSDASLAFNYWDLEKPSVVQRLEIRW
jgi:hypothetical protein